jgi:hypothetical protein
VVEAVKAGDRDIYVQQSPFKVDGMQKVPLESLSIAMKSLHAKLREFGYTIGAVKTNLSLIARGLSTCEAYWTPTGWLGNVQH